jgi:plasmid stabilization system protein ParE
MKYRLLIKAEAIQDITQAFNWYEETRTGLGSEFLNEIEQYYTQICSNPQQYQSQRNERIAVMRRFPYKIVYGIEADEIVVYAVYHDKRNPEKLTGRQ